MTVRLGRLSLAVAALLMALGLAVPASAQVYTGRIDVTVKDATGAVLPGVTVDISGPENQEAVTDALGEAHFLNLSVGTYQVKAALQGFSAYTNNNVAVAAGSPVVLPVTLGVAGVAQAVQVTAEAPVISPKKTTIGVTISQRELSDIPTARDPWVVLQTVPGVIVDRQNVGGSESGQQSIYEAGGAATTDNTWNLDGIPITDMAATGSTPTYFDFSAFKEMQATTGGSDPQVATPGVQMNLILKSGENTPHGDGHYYFENQNLQANNLPSALAATIGGTSGKGDRMNQYQDRGFDLGGPLVKDKLWAWGSFGQTNVNILTLNDYPANTLLRNYALKVTDQTTKNIRSQFTYFRGNKVVAGRSIGSTRPPETAWNQTGPTTMYKGQMSFVIGNNLFLTARGAHIATGFALAPEGGMSTEAYQDANGVWHGSFVNYSTNRPQDTALVDGNYFKGRNEVKFGFSWRRTTVNSASTWPGPNMYSINLGGGSFLGVVARPFRLNMKADYYAAYAGDTISLNRVTLNLALRYDHQSSSALTSNAPADVADPTLLPSITAPGVAGPGWQLVSPRIGITYALDSSRKTIARASYSLFSSQLGAGAGTAAFASAVPIYSYAYYIGAAANGQYLTPTDLPNASLVGSLGINVNNPTQLQAYNTISSSLKSPRTQEFTVGLDRELMANFGLSANFTYRRFTNLIWTPLIGVTSADYSLDGTVSGNVAPIGSYSAPYYAINPSAIPLGGGEVYSNHPGYHQRFMGFAVSATKRMSNHWMARFGFSTNNDKEYYDNPAVAIQDPTKTPTTPLINGGDVVTESAGSGKSGIYLVMPKYQFTADGLYEGPWGLNFGADLAAVQGYAEPYYSGNTQTSDQLHPTKSVLLVSSVDQYRLPATVLLSARVQKVFKVNRVNFKLDFDVFNLFNNATVLGRQFNVNTGSSANSILEIMNPRIARLGLEINF